MQSITTYQNLKRIFKLSVFLCFFACNLRVAEPYLVHEGKTEFKIVLSDSPKPVEQTAAKELKAYLDTITRMDWTIVSEKEIPEEAPQILIGNSSRAKKFFPEIAPSQIPYDGIEIHLKGNKLLLTGHEQRGTLYAVNTFLEDVLGVNWWTSSEQTIPTFSTFRLKPLHISYAPKLIYRESHYKDMYEAPIFATRMKSNGVFYVKYGISPEYGDYQRFAASFCHTFHLFIPPGKYFADHPEWFSEINGVRNAHAQLCLTNDEMRKELTKNVIETLRNHPGSNFVSITQNDNAGYCTCEKCSQIAEEEESQSGPLIRFVNAVAEDIEEEFPDVLVETLAYQYTRKPTQHVKPRRNVLIRYCTLESSVIQPLTGEQNKALCDDMTGWSKISHQLFVWYYVANFGWYILPNPNLHTIAPNIRFFVDCGTTGTFVQGDLYCPVGDFIRMRNWVASHLMWNPSLDEKELTRKFISGYYGKKAAPFLLEYFDVLINKAESTGNRIEYSMESTDNWLDYETLCQATALFDKAIAAVADEKEFVRRLHRERLPLELVWLRGYPAFKRIAEIKGEKFLGPADPEKACMEFFAACEAYQVTQFAEYQPIWFPNFKNSLLFHCSGQQASVPDELKDIDPKMWMDFQDYDFQHVNVIWISTLKDWTVIADSTASNGYAVKMPPPHPYSENIVKLPIENVAPLFEDVGSDTQFKIIAYVRCDSLTEEGAIMTCGINGDKGILAQKKINVSDIAGSEYQTIAFEKIPFTPSMTVWFGWPKQDKAAQTVYIDRVLVIKEKTI